jgi:hypothetical protein
VSGVISIEEIIYFFIGNYIFFVFCFLYSWAYGVFLDVGTIKSCVDVVFLLRDLRRFHMADRDEKAIFLRRWRF